MRPIHYWLISFLSCHSTQNMFVGFFPFFSHFLCMKDLQGKIKCARSSANCQLVLIHIFCFERRHRNNKWKRTATTNRHNYIFWQAYRTRAWHWIQMSDSQWRRHTNKEKSTIYEHLSVCMFHEGFSHFFFHSFRFLFQIVRNFSDAFVKW